MAIVTNTLEVKIGKLRLASPLLTASGTSGSSDELRRLKEAKNILSSLGAFVTKGVTLHPRSGNPEFRVVETRNGLLNSIGLQNKGAEVFTRKELPSLLGFHLPVIVNISASSVEEFGALASYLIDSDVNEMIAGIEINVSCPNIHEGGAAFGANPRLVERIVQRVTRCTGERVLTITKLSPNVTDVTISARAAIAGGTGALSMINTLKGMAIDVENKRPFLGNIHGGLSGPAIKPVGVFMVYDCFRRIPECRNRRVPIIGIGGISEWSDALEYIMAGATAVGIGTAWFVRAEVLLEIRDGLASYLETHGGTIADLIGCTHAS